MQKGHAEMCSIGTDRQHEQLFKAKNINLDFIITILQCYTRTNCIYCDYMVHVHGKIIQNLHNKLLPLTYCISSSLKSYFSLTTFETCFARSWPSPPSMSFVPSAIEYTGEASKGTAILFPSTGRTKIA